jgi:hypothetical protein
LEQLLLGEDLPTAGIGGYVSYVGRRSWRRQSKAIEGFSYTWTPAYSTAESLVPAPHGALQYPLPSGWMVRRS